MVIYWANNIIVKANALYYSWCVCACVLTNSNRRPFDDTVIANFLSPFLFFCPPLILLSPAPFSSKPLHYHHLFRFLVDEWTKTAPVSNNGTKILESIYFAHSTATKCTKYFKRFEFQSFGHLISIRLRLCSIIVFVETQNLCFLIKVKTNGDGHAEITSNYHYFRLDGMNAINQFVSSALGFRLHSRLLSRYLIAFHS